MNSAKQMAHSTLIGLTRTIESCCPPDDLDWQNLFEVYDAIANSNRLYWSTSLQIKKKIGSGGQGSVYLAQRVGADGFNLPVAVKFFSPERYKSVDTYDLEMQRIGRIASEVARIQHENLLVVNHFLDRNRVRIMVMEQIEGFDLRRLLTAKMYGSVKERFSRKLWEHINESLVTAGPSQPRMRLKPALSIVRDCLSALAALHREGIAHSDIKPSNIMLNRSGNAKIIDVGSAVLIGDEYRSRTCTPVYSAPEILSGCEPDAQSDLASIGYVAIELLAGQPLFSETEKLSDLIIAKENLADRFCEILPADVVKEKSCISFLAQLIAPERQNRFQSAEAAVVECAGVTDANFSNSGKDYKSDTRIWIEELLEAENLDE